MGYASGSMALVFRLWNEEYRNPYEGMTEVERLTKVNEELNKMGVQVLEEMDVLEADRNRLQSRLEDMVDLVRKARKQREDEEFDETGDADIATMDRLFALAEQADQEIERPSYNQLIGHVRTLREAIMATGIHGFPDSALDLPELQVSDAKVDITHIEASAIRQLKFALEHTNIDNE